MKGKENNETLLKTYKRGQKSNLIILRFEVQKKKIKILKKTKKRVRRTRNTNKFEKKDENILQILRVITPETSGPKRQTIKKVTTNTTKQRNIQRH